APPPRAAVAHAPDLEVFPCLVSAAIGLAPHPNPPRVPPQRALFLLRFSFFLLGSLPANPSHNLPAPRRSKRRSGIDTTEARGRDALRIARLRLKRTGRCRIVHLRAIERIEEFRAETQLSTAGQLEHASEAELLVRPALEAEVVVEGRRGR